MPYLFPRPELHRLQDCWRLQDNVLISRDCDLGFFRAADLLSRCCIRECNKKQVHIVRLERIKLCRVELQSSDSLEERVLHGHEHTSIDTVLDESSEWGAVCWIDILMIGMNNSVPLCATDMILARVAYSLTDTKGWIT